MFNSIVAHNPVFIWALCSTFIQTFSFQTNPVFGFPSTSSDGNYDGSNLNRYKEPNYLFLAQNARKSWGHNQKHASEISTALKASVEASDQETSGNNDVVDNEIELMEQNSRYIKMLMSNLGSALDKWVLLGLPASRVRAYNILKQIERESKSEELVKEAERLVLRSGMTLAEPPSLSDSPTEKKEISTPTPPSSTTTTTTQPKNKLEYNSSVQDRKDDVQARKEWETFRESAEGVQNNIGKQEKNFARSALSSRLPATMSKTSSASEKAKAFTEQVGEGNLDPFSFSKEKKELQDELASVGEENKNDETDAEVDDQVNEAITKTSELVARAGAGSAFEGQTLGIGGLDDVLSQVKRRIWVPLAAPPSLLKELGINPVRGLLLYGRPGCGKTLLARTLGRILSPSRPITVVSGPEIMDKFVGSSEANLREVFDNPPDLYPHFLTDDEKVNDLYSRAALHVIVLDEFDAMARARGGSGGKGDQGDAGVARDSVVNQLLAKMDGVDGLGVPTLVIGLTNKRTLIEPALLRPGRFEVQIEVPPPRTVEQRVSILKVHMNSMFKAGRVLVRDAPTGTAAFKRLERKGRDNVLSYDELVNLLAVECDGMSGASIAGVCRAAASRALERAVWDFAGSIDTSGYDDVEGSSIADCLVTQADFEKAIEDVFESSKGGDYSEDEDENEDEDEDENENEKDENE